MSKNDPRKALGKGLHSLLPSRPQAPAAAGRSFADEHSRAGKSGSLQFSKHALERVARRGIDLDPATLSRLS